jgi:hypothetical protein
MFKKGFVTFTEKYSIIEKFKLSSGFTQGLIALQNAVKELSLVGRLKIF